MGSFSENEGGYIPIEDVVPLLLTWLAISISSTKIVNSHNVMYNFMSFFTGEENTKKVHSLFKRRLFKQFSLSHTKSR